jgi:hypothetical protein
MNEWRPTAGKTSDVMANGSDRRPRHAVLCPERSLIDMQDGTRFAETIRASGLVHRVNRPDTRPLLKPRTSHQKGLAMQQPSTQDKAVAHPRR